MSSFLQGCLTFLNPENRCIGLLVLCLFHHMFTAQACPARAGLLEHQQMLDEDTQKNAGWGPQCKHHHDWQRTSTLAPTQQWWTETLEGPAFASWLLGLLANCWWAIAWHHTKENHLAQNGTKKKRDTVHMYSSPGLLRLKPKGIGLCVIQKEVKRCKILHYERTGRGVRSSTKSHTHFCMKGRSSQG
jgi:hypothetical protein